MKLFNAGNFPETIIDRVPPHYCSSTCCYVAWTPRANHYQWRKKLWRGMIPDVKFPQKRKSKEVSVKTSQLSLSLVNKMDAHHQMLPLSSIEC